MINDLHKKTETTQLNKKNNGTCFKGTKIRKIENINIIYENGIIMVMTKNETKMSNVIVFLLKFRLLS